MKASVIGVGTELTTGQIANKNATWISQQLKALGFITSTHLTVPDERTLILKALDFCSQESEIIFVTGGLGPTSDDFTRELIAQWNDKKLIFDNESWTSVQQILNSRGVTVKDMQKQQCYFPEGAKILKNSKGTADGFYLFSKEKHFFILPGPPKEIAAIWEVGIQPWLLEQQKNLDIYITKSWDIMGKPESDIAQVTEEVLAGSPLEIGYRVHLPYVEVKVSYFKSEQKQVQPWLEKLDAALSPLTILKDGEDIVQKFAEALLPYTDISFSDQVSGHWLLARLLTQGKAVFGHKRYSFNGTASAQAHFVLKKTADNQFSAEIQLGGATLNQNFSTPFKSPDAEERRVQYSVEVALIFWLKVLR
ncbi:MAG: competence/damage-inducible protein A [Pseudobdellovibrionaceae bacterium]